MSTSETYEKYHCNLCAAVIDRLHQTEHWDGTPLMLCPDCATESIDPKVRGINAANPDAVRHRADQIAEWETQRRRAEREADEEYLEECRPLLAEKSRLMRALQADDLSDITRHLMETELTIVHLQLSNQRSIRDLSLLLQSINQPDR